MNTRPDPSIPLANQYTLVLVADGVVNTEPVDEPHEFHEPTSTDDRDGEQP